ncbi:MAG: hypothetical protein QM793_00360 [Muricomes sp.]
MDKSALNDYIGQHNTYDTKDYTAESYAAYADSFAKAKAVAGSSYYSQDETDAAKVNLQNAVDGLVPAEAPPMVPNTTRTLTGENLSVAMKANDGGSTIADWGSKITKVIFNGTELEKDQYKISGSSLVLVRTDDKPLVTTSSRQTPAKLIVQAKSLVH